MFSVSLLLLLFIQPVQTSVEDLTEIGKVYKVCGYFQPVKPLEKGCIYELIDGIHSVKAVEFKGECIGGYRCVYGRLEVYRGEKELVVLSNA